VGAAPRMMAAQDETSGDGDGGNVSRLRTPPHSIEAEQSLLGCLMLDKGVFAAISEAMAPADIYGRAHRLIFDAIARLVVAGAPVDIVTVYEQLDGETNDYGGIPYLNQLAGCVQSAANARRYAEIVAERAALRAIIARADEMATRAFQPNASPAQVLDEAKVELGRIEQQRSLTSRRLPLVSLQQLSATAQAARYLIKHLIPAESIGMLFGGSGTFKSFIALDAALHVAHGLPWLGRRTVQGPVLYIAAEGGSGLWYRADAWHRARRLPWQKAPLHIVPMALDLTTEAWRVVEAAQSAGVTPSLVVVDTLSQTFGGEENSANEVAAYMREIGTRFRQLWRCAVLLIHHSGHAATERPRGSSAMRANTDYLYGVSRDEKEMLATLSCVHRKDGEGFDDTTFQLTQQVLGEDDDGDKITSLVARHLSSAEEVEEAMATESKAGRVGKHQLLLQLAQNGMKEADLRRAFYEDCGLDNLESRRQAFHRAKNWATKSGFLDIAQGVVITLKKGF
jgi:RecA-family ATPase